MKYMFLGFQARIGGYVLVEQTVVYSLRIMVTEYKQTKQQRIGRALVLHAK